LLNWDLAVPSAPSANSVVSQLSAAPQFDRTSFASRSFQAAVLADVKASARDLPAAASF
jgi:hypothetical protein